MKNSYQILADHYGRLVKIGKRNKVMCKIFKKVLSRRFNKLISGLSEEDKRLQERYDRVKERMERFKREN